MTTKTRTVAMVNTKGGVGKTTSAFMFALGLARLGLRVTLRDADPQGSATEWVDRAVSSGFVLPFSLELANKVSLARPCPSDWVVIDTPPGDSGVVSAAVAAADFIVIPTASGGMDAVRMWATLDATVGKDRAVLVTRAAVGTNALESLLEVIEEEGVPVFDTLIRKREGLVQAFGTVPESLGDYESAVGELIGEML